eukprot:TRINITY_DN93853_c0_g1_i1.p1 TRINITY_DN93853_c0_g1~~TRINITY_DN93853_c0_g1_i1.p1  ORF type:complete len:431 (-),score=86.93 TRINITY_DN93853_c0_g1_i1:198-1469(-)
MALSKDDLLSKLTSWNIVHETIGHALSPTCEIHSENIKGTAFEKFIGKGQAKNLFFKVPSGGGPLKNRLFLVCALVETAVDNKILSSRLGIKPSAPLRFAADEIFTDVLQIPKGSVNPFVMAQASCDDVVLLLDKNFLECDRLLFHPMQSDFTTALAPDQLTAFLERVSPSRFMYVDLTSNEKISLPESGSSASPSSAKKTAPAANAKKAEQPKATEAKDAAHGFRDSKVADALASLGSPITVDPIGCTNAAGRLEGHTTHNFFVYDKKDKEKRLLVTVAQSSAVDMKAIPDIVGAKEVRLCAEGDTLLGSAKGCVTPLSLLYDSGKKVQWFVDEALLSEACWRLGTSGEGVMPGTIADVPVAVLKDILAPTGHWDSKRPIDCSRWATAAPAIAQAPAISIPDLSDPSSWYQPPYKTASGRIL